MNQLNNHKKDFNILLFEMINNTYEYILENHYDRQLVRELGSSKKYIKSIIQLNGSLIMNLMGDFLLTHEKHIINKNDSFFKNFDFTNSMDKDEEYYDSVKNISDAFKQILNNKDNKKMRDETETHIKNLLQIYKKVKKCK